MPCRNPESRGNAAPGRVTPALRATAPLLPGALRAACLAAVASVLAAAAALAQPPPRELWRLPLPGQLPQAVQVDDGSPRHLYVAAKAGGLQVLEQAKDGSTVQVVARVGIADLGGLHVMNLHQHGRVLYLVLGDFFAARGARAGLATVDVSNPRRPRVLGQWRSEAVIGGAAAVTADGRHAYLGAMAHGIFVLDVTTPRTPRLLTRFLPDPNYPTASPGRTRHPNARGMVLSNDLLVLANDAGGLRTLDVSNPARPVELGRFVNPALGRKPHAYNNVALRGELAIVAVDYCGLEVIDIANPSRPTLRGWWNPWNCETFGNIWFNSPGHSNQISLSRDGRLAFLSAGDSELQVVDVGRPSTPVLVASVGAPRNGEGVWGATQRDGTAYLSYITSIIPFRGTWSGVRAVRVGVGARR